MAIKKTTHEKVKDFFQVPTYKRKNTVKIFDDIRPFKE